MPKNVYKQWFCKTFSRVKTELEFDMIITKEWLERAGKPCGPRGFAWTKAQLSMFGIRYPLKSGWQDKIIGREISEEIAKAFIENKNVVTKYALRARRKRDRRKKKAKSENRSLHPEFDPSLSPPWE